MKKLLPLIFTLAGGLTLLTTACAQKDQGFESKTFINKDKSTNTTTDRANNKDGKDKELGSQTNTNNSQSTDGNLNNEEGQSNDNSILENTISESLKDQAPAAQDFISKNNPSNMRETELVIQVKKIQTLNANQNLKLIPLEAQVVLFDQKARHGYILGKIDIKTQDSKNEDNITVNESLVVSRDEINDRIAKLSSMSANPSLMIEVNLVKKVDSDSSSIDETTNVPDSCNSLSAVRMGLFSISKQEQEIVGSSPNCSSTEQNKEEALLLSVSFSTSGEYQVENGYVSNNQNLICEIKSELNDEQNLLIHINNKNLRLINDSGSIDIINLFYKVIVNPLVSDSSIIANHKVNFSNFENDVQTITAKSHNSPTSSSLTSIKQETCAVEDSNISEFNYSVQFTISEQQTTQFKGCCMPSGNYINTLRSATAAQSSSDVEVVPPTSSTSEITDTHSTLTVD